MKKILMFILIVTIVFVSVFSYAYAALLPEKSADYSEVISEPVQRYIDTENEKLQDACGAQIVIATTKTTNEYSTHEYADRLFKSLGLASGSNNVLVVMFTGSMDYAVTVSEDISRSLTRGYAEKSVAENMEPLFAKKDFSGAAVKAYNSLAAWYESNYKTDSLGLTDDMTQYESMISDEKHDARMRHINIALVIVLIVVLTVAGFVYFRRKIRLIKAENKRKERRIKYLRKINRY